ncbi:MAG: glutamine--fructose-6-phosphate transaminase (isomerizing) [Elusimicrobia bacterium]|nr:glutamine--fructose-6-phosphate transaminase (isomerizing) [Elusimicrobiota bacterium]
MCGIVGYIGSRPAVPILMEGLRRLEYRGYDSAGIAALAGGVIDRRRASGKLGNLDALLRDAPLKGTLAIGHTRWATHGKPSEENAHPHMDCTKSLVVIHNGIIENYLEIKDALTASGHKFESETDTEAVVHLIEEKIKALSKRARADFNDPLLFEAVRQALNEVRGAYALAVLWSKAPGTIIAAKTASPLVIGLGTGESFLASDVPAFLEHTRNAVFLDDGEMAVLKSAGCSYFTLAGKKVRKQVHPIAWDRTMAEKAGHKHFMIKEIHEQPEACEDSMRGRLYPLRDGVLQREAGLDPAVLRGLRQIYLVACGTAHHACMIGRYWIEDLADVPAQVEIASEFRYREHVLGPKDLVVAVSQSGETADTLAAVRSAKDKGSKVFAVCNCVGSAITRAADFVLYTRCGPECGVASTKAFIGQLTGLALFAVHAGIARGSLKEARAREIVEDLVRIPGRIRAALKLEPRIIEIAEALHKKSNFLYIARHLNFPIAMEGALKLKEISYIHAEGYAAGELKHGPIALVDGDIPVMVIATRSKVQDKLASNVMEVRARGGRCIILCAEGDKVDAGKDDYVLRLPPMDELLSPIVNVVPLQLLAYHIAVLRGCDVDQPRNLAKSVTVE